MYSDVQTYVSSHSREQGYAGRIEVVTGPTGRRRWPERVKAAIVLEELPRRGVGFGRGAQARYLGAAVACVAAGGPRGAAADAGGRGAGAGGNGGAKVCHGSAVMVALRAAKNSASLALPGRQGGRGIFTVELYRKVRLACRDGMSERAAARHFGIARETVKKMLSFSVPPGYRRQAEIKRPKLDGFTEIINR
jgi:hypothetical protein